MLIDVFKKQIRTNITKSGFTTGKWVKIVCDECGAEKNLRYASFDRGRKRRGSEIDLCLKCSYLSKYKFSIFRNKMEKAVNWNGGESIGDGGYIKLYVGDGKRIYKHVKIYENYINRKLLKNECLHHIDLNKLNNKINNLYLCSDKKEHQLCHVSLQNVALSFLNKKVWFDRKSKKYIVNYIFQENIQNIKIEDIPEKYNICIGTCGKSRIKYKKFFKDGKYKFVHTYMAENIIGRKLYAYECVHHIDGDTLNNNIFNLAVMSRSEHSKSHKSLEECGMHLYEREYIKFELGRYRAA